MEEPQPIQKNTRYSLFTVQRVQLCDDGHVVFTTEMCDLLVIDKPLSIAFSTVVSMTAGTWNGRTAGILTQIHKIFDRLGTIRTYAIISCC